MLYIVATPIGNLKDITLRALEVLKSVELIACEDTRHSLKLLNYYEIKKPLVSCHKFNEEKSSDRIIEDLKAGKNIALITDAGTPIISDPGNVLIKKLISENLEYTVIPGACALISALLLSGFDASKFSFIGFLPERNKDREKLLEGFKNVPSTLIFYSAPQNVDEDIKTLFSSLGNRKACVVREITKIFEEVKFFELESGILGEKKGEYVIVVEGGKQILSPLLELSEKEHIDFYINNGMSKMDAIKQVAKERNVAKSSLYKYTL